MARKSDVEVKFTQKAVSKEEVLKALEKARLSVSEAALLAGNYAVEIVVKNAPKVKAKAKKIVKEVKKNVELKAPIVKEKAKKIAKGVEKNVKLKAPIVKAKAKKVAKKAIKKVKKSIK